MRKIERKIVNSSPVSFFKKLTQKIIPPGFEGLSLYEVGKFFFAQVKNLNLRDRAQSIAFNITLAIPATTLFLVTLIPHLPISKMFMHELRRLVRDLSPSADTQSTINAFLDDFFTNQHTGLLSFGFLLVVFYSSNAMMGVIRTFDKSNFDKSKTNFLKKRLRAVRLTIIILVLILGTLLILMGQGILLKWIMQEFNINNENAREWIKMIRWLFIVPLFFYSIAFIYKYAPSAKERFRLISPGVILATTLILLFTWLLAIWVNKFNQFNQLYGSIGTIMILLIVIFLNSLILLVGFELNVSIKLLKKQQQERIAAEEQQQFIEN